MQDHYGLDRAITSRVSLGPVDRNWQDLRCFSSEVCDHGSLVVQICIARAEALMFHLSFSVYADVWINPGPLGHGVCSLACMAKESAGVNIVQVSFGFVWHGNCMRAVDRMSSCHGLAPGNDFMSCASL